MSSISAHRPKSTPDHFAKVCQKLGLDAGLIVPDMKLEEPFSFLEAYVASEDFDSTVIDRLMGKDVADSEPADEVSSEDGMADGEHGGEAFGAEFGTDYGDDDLTSRIQPSYWNRDSPGRGHWTICR